VNGPTSVVEPKLFVSASAPATALELPVITDFMLKSTVFYVFNERKST
jgi:hypothetical protein